jgi:hypothetical protein
MDVVTGAFSYTGSYMARRLLDSARRVRTLSWAPIPNTRSPLKSSLHGWTSRGPGS